MHETVVHVLPVFAMHFWYGIAVHEYQNVQSVLFSISVLHGERQPPQTAVHACIEELCLHW